MVSTHKELTVGEYRCDSTGKRSYSQRDQENVEVTQQEEQR